jgi:hypothetical protein
MRNFRAVLFDWRGTLALPMSGPQWIQEGFRRLHLVSALLGWPPFAPADRTFATKLAQTPASEAL